MHSGRARTQVRRDDPRLQGTCDPVRRRERQHRAVREARRQARGEDDRGLPRRAARRRREMGRESGQDDRRRADGGVRQARGRLRRGPGNAAARERLASDRRRHARDPHRVSLRAGARGKERFLGRRSEHGGAACRAREGRTDSHQRRHREDSVRHPADQPARPGHDPGEGQAGSRARVRADVGRHRGFPAGEGRADAGTRGVLRRRGGRKNGFAQSRAHREERRAVCPDRRIDQRHLRRDRRRSRGAAAPRPHHAARPRQDRLRHFDRGGGRAAAVRLFVTRATGVPPASRGLPVLNFGFFRGVDVNQVASAARAPVSGKEHWARKGGAHGVRLFLWQKPPAAGTRRRGTVLFVHGSSMASQPTFDLHVPGRPDSSAMDWFAARGFDTWCMDHEGYGRSDKSRAINCDIANGAEDIEAGSEYVLEATGGKKLLVYGISSGALRAALFAQAHPERVARLALDAFVWTGEGSPTLAERKKKLPEFSARNRRPIDRAFVHSIFERDHPGTADKATVDAFAEAIVALDDSVPTGTYVDMCSKLPIVDPAKIAVPTIVMRGQWDGIASIEDLIEFFKRLPNPDKQFAVMAGVSHASFQQKNYLMVYHILHSFFSQPEPAYQG